MRTRLEIAFCIYRRQKTYPHTTRSGFGLNNVMENEQNFCPGDAGILCIPLSLLSLYRPGTPAGRLWHDVLITFVVFRKEQIATDSSWHDVKISPSPGRKFSPFTTTLFKPNPNSGCVRIRFLTTGLCKKRFQIVLACIS